MRRRRGPVTHVYIYGAQHVAPLSKSTILASYDSCKLSIRCFQERAIMHINPAYMGAQLPSIMLGILMLSLVQAWSAALRTPGGGLPGFIVTDQSPKDATSR